jgi:putative thioredoxin
VLARIDPRGPLAYNAEALRQVVALGQATRDYGGEDKARAELAKNDADLEARYALGCALAVRGETGPALEQFLEIVTRSRKFREDAGRRAMLTLFDQPGVDAELVRDFRRRLQIVT